MSREQPLPRTAASSGGWKIGRPAGGATDPPPSSSAALPPLVQQTLRRLGPLNTSGEAVLRLLQQTDDQPAAVIAAVQLCPTLTARLLSVVTSASLGVSWWVASAPYAVQLLGPRRARSVALAYALRAMVRDPTLPGDVVDKLWAASLHKAVAARLFCDAVDPEHADGAYAMGLIQDVGLRMLMAADPGFYQPAPPGPQIVAAERAHFGLTHGAVAQELLLSWRAGEKLQQMVLGHHRPPPDDGEPLLLANHVASLLPHADEPLAPSSLEALERYHARFLRSRYETVDAFLLAVADEVHRICEPRRGGAAVDSLSFMSRLVSAVTQDAISAQTRLCKIEQAYRGQRESFTNLRVQAFTDALTRLLNRRGFMELAERRLTDGTVTGRGVCLMVFDLDGLKGINDTYGHDAGDMLLRGFAKLLRRYLDEDDLIARFGGDEYAAMIADVDEATARRVAERIEGQIHRSRLRLKPDLEVDVRCSIGAVFYDRAAGPAEIDSVLSQADHVMYQRKRSGKAGLAFERYSPASGLAEAGDSRVGAAVQAEQASA